MARKSWESVLLSLELPQSYSFDLAVRKHVPARLIPYDTTTGAKIGKLHVPYMTRF
jgi:hypothetical protein